jgi:porin
LIFLIKYYYIYCCWKGASEPLKKDLNSSVTTLLIILILFMKIIRSLGVAAIIATCSFNAFAKDLGHFNNTLTGDWNKAREKLYNHGLNVKINYKADIFHNLGGGKAKGGKILDRTIGNLSFDGEKLFNIPGLTASVTYFHTTGGNPDEFVGSALGTDAMAAPQAKNKSRFYEAWVQQNFASNKVSVLFGLLDINNEFLYADSASIFIHQIDGISRDPSLFVLDLGAYSNTTLRVKITPQEEFYLQGALVDHALANDEFPSYDFLYVAEAGYKPKFNSKQHKFALGYFGYREKINESTLSTTKPKKRSKGFYVLAENKLYNEMGDENQGLTSFIRVNFADKEVSRFDNTINVGLFYKGINPNNKESKLAFGITKSHFSKNYLRVVNATKSNYKSSETTYELTYSDDLLPWLNVQPDFQYITHPAGAPNLKSAKVVGLRFLAKI